MVILIYQEGISLLRRIIVYHLIFLYIIGCNGHNLSKLEYYEKGMTSLENGNPKSAIIYFKNAIERDHNYFEARYHLARAYVSLGKFKSAEMELIKVIRLSPSFDDARVLLVKTYVKNGKPDEALKEINLYLQKIQDNPEVYALAGSAYAAKADYVKAEGFAEKSIELSPKEVSSKIILAKIYSKQGKFLKANSLVDEVLEVNKNNKEALYLLASIKQQTGNLDDASSAYQKIIEVNPEEVMLKRLMKPQNK
jgi:tetratricopeptide (TPR) repeat protein